MESYTLASSMLSLWTLSARTYGYVDTWLNKRDYLHESRVIYENIAKDPSAEIHFRLRALTDAGNSYDIVGRYMDAIDCYDRALMIDPSFAMALGNRGLALLYAAPFMREHERHVILQAAADLDAAIDNRESVLQNGGESALEEFQRKRSSIGDFPDQSNTGSRTKPKFSDPHLNWCLNQGLFLHASPDNIHDNVKILDPIFFRKIITGIDTEDILHTNEIIDAFNTIKQDYLTARYLLWIASAQESGIRKHTQSITRRASFLNTLQYGRWGIRTGIATQAFKAAVDVLDKIAAFAHLYFGTTQAARLVSFRNLPYQGTRGRSVVTHFSQVLRPTKFNYGLSALVDLSYELDSRWSSPLLRNVQRRHAATHRFLTVHTEVAPDSSSWTQRMNWADIIENALFQLRLGRSAIFYLARMIDINEQQKSSANFPHSVVMPMPFSRVDTDLAESE